MKLRLDKIQDCDTGFCPLLTIAFSNYMGITRKKHEPVDVMGCEQRKCEIFNRDKGQCGFIR